jgi:hypothetical protein
MIERHPIANSWMAHIRDSFPRLSESTYWIAGGAVRNVLEGHNRPQKDIDFYGSTQENLDRLQLNLYKLGWQQHYESQYARTFTHERETYKVQVIHTTYPDVKSCLEGIDYTVAQCAFTDEYFHFGPWTLEDHSHKALRLNMLQHHSNLIARLVKYVEYGYLPDQSTLDQITKALQRPSVRYKKYPY